MRRQARLALLLALSCGLSTRLAAEEEVGCVVCHGAENRMFGGTVHASQKIGCTDCHGGNPDALDKELAHADGFQGFTEAAAGVQLCGSCHSDAERMRSAGLRTDQLALYVDSPHGRLLAEDPDARVATCVTCHGAHAVFRTLDPRSPAHKFRQPETCGECHADESAMEAVGLSADVVDEYRRSAHGRGLLERSLLSSPACTDCHGSHGATPPGVDELGTVCGDCHTVVRNYFERGPHLAAVQDGAMEECISCHGWHGIGQPTDSMLEGAGPGHCATCHRDEDDPGRATAEALYAGLEDLRTSIEETEAVIHAGSSRGLFMEREHGYLGEARSLLARTRSMTHAASARLVTDALDRGHGMIAQTHDSLESKERTLRDRKIFTGILLAVTGLLAAVLQVYRVEVFGAADRPVSGGRVR